MFSYTEISSACNSISCLLYKSVLLKSKITSTPKAFAETKNLSIKVVVVIGFIKVAIKIAWSILEAIICVCLDRFTDLRTMEFFLSYNFTIIKESSDFSTLTLSPTTIGLVLLIPFIRNFPFNLHSSKSSPSDFTKYQLPVDFITTPFIAANIQLDFSYI